MIYYVMAPKSLNYLAFQSIDFERTRLRLFQEHVVNTKFDIYVYIAGNICKNCVFFFTVVYRKKKDFIAMVQQLIKTRDTMQKKRTFYYLKIKSISYLKIVVKDEI